MEKKKAIILLVIVFVVMLFAFSVIYFKNSEKQAGERKLQSTETKEAEIKNDSAEQVRDAIKKMEEEVISTSTQEVLEKKVNEAVKKMEQAEEKDPAIEKEQQEVLEAIKKMQNN